MKIVVYGSDSITYIALSDSLVSHTWRQIISYSLRNTEGQRNCLVEKGIPAVSVDFTY